MCSPLFKINFSNHVFSEHKENEKQLHSETYVAVGNCPEKRKMELPTVGMNCTLSASLPSRKFMLTP